jgi:hypothetical protein
MANTRVFNGETFKLKSAHNSKSEAQFDARDIRKMGKKARVVKEKDTTFGKGYSYSIYVR